MEGRGLEGNKGYGTRARQRERKREKERIQKKSGRRKGRNTLGQETFQTAAPESGGGEQGRSAQ